MTPVVSDSGYVTILKNDESGSSVVVSRQKDGPRTSYAFARFNSVNKIDVDARIAFEDGIDGATSIEPVLVSTDGDGITRITILPPEGDFDLLSLKRPEPASQRGRDVLANSD